MLGESSTGKTYQPVSLCFVVSKVFEKLVNNGMVDHVEKCGSFPDFQTGFRSSRSTGDLLTVVSERIAGAFNRYRATQAILLDLSENFDRVCMLVFFTNVSLMEFELIYFALLLLFSVISSFGRF